MSSCVKHQWYAHNSTNAEIHPPCPWCQLKVLRQRICAKDETIALLEKERNLIMAYVFNEPPFDAFNGIDLHEEASINASAFGRDEANSDDYYAAFLTCIAGYLGGGDE